MVTLRGAAASFFLLSDLGRIDHPSILTNGARGERSGRARAVPATEDSLNEPPVSPALVAWLLALFAVRLQLDNGEGPRKALVAAGAFVSYLAVIRAILDVATVNEVVSVERLHPTWVTELDPTPGGRCGWTIFKDPAGIPAHLLRTARG